MRPPEAVRICLEAVWALLKRERRIPKWTEVQRLLGSKDFKNAVLDFDPGQAPAPLRVFVHSSFLRDDGDEVAAAASLERITRASLVCGVLWRWVRYAASDVPSAAPGAIDEGDTLQTDPSPLCEEEEAAVAVQTAEIDLLQKALLGYNNSLQLVSTRRDRLQDELADALSCHSALAERAGYKFVWSQQKK